MKDPTAISLEMLKKLARYLAGKPRIARRFFRQAWLGKFVEQVDSDFAGCVLTRRSTTGTATFHGDHCLEFTSNLQATEALSTGEAEFYASVKGTAIGLGMISISVDMGLSLSLELQTDATAGKGIVLRLGAGRIKHIETQFLWIQRVFYEKRASIKKIPREINGSDLGTHHCTSAEIAKHLKTLGFVVLEGDSQIALRAAV